MWSRGGPRSSALDRAKAQLSGQRISNIAILKDKRDEENFVQPSRQTHIQDLSDASSPSQIENQNPAKSFSLGGGSRFLKKTSKDTTTERTSAGTDESKIIPQRSSQSAALSKLALIENRIRNQKSTSNHTEPQETRLSVHSSGDLSMTGGRFLKKRIASEPQELRFSETTPGLNERRERRVSLDSDEQDMRRLIGDSISLSESSLLNAARQKSPQVVKKVNTGSTGKSTVPTATPEKHKVISHRSLSPSSRRPESRMVRFTERSLSSETDHSEIHSLDDLFPAAPAHDSEDTLSEMSAASDDFKLNVMTLDDLAPIPSEAAEISQEIKETQARKEDRKKKSPEISKVASQPTPEDVYESDFESEIASEITHSEISERLSDEDKDTSLVSEAQYSSYKSQDDDDDHDEHTLSQSSVSSSGNSDSSSNSSSSNATVTRGPSPERNVKEAAVQTQVDGFAYTWSSGMAAAGPSIGMKYVDPTPIASHTVSAEAIETLTSYSPAIFALNDMLRQQLGLTRAFIASTRHHYTSVLESLGPADYKYTTLQDTKEFIQAHRPPKTSIEDALEEVQQEMKDSHYI
ncbi:uncharacterized protein C19orf44 homolog isoform X2 [Danio aesculapii]|uniref:uncharacterized protein C19orf44 homolog isoform X2 n=1 Tax=Danio aesculapii TaxID=1142201 RepID=UPI0024BF7095|nr:uncharacterized protein C19orf44 homolog isoform X2 [Danio aesculapii]